MWKVHQFCDLPVPSTVEMSFLRTQKHEFTLFFSVSALLNLQKLGAPPDALLPCQCPSCVRLINHGMLPGDTQTPASLRPSSAEHAATPRCAHPCAETVGLLAVAVVRLEGALHLNPTPQYGENS